MARSDLVFVSYRHADSGAVARLIPGALEELVPPVRVFVDSSAIDAGEDWTYRIRKALLNSGALLAVIGPSWQVRTDQPELDYVRREIEWMLEKQRCVLPVLVGGATMPDERALPGSLARLARTQGFCIRQEHLAADLRDLAARVSKLVKKLPDTYLSGKLQASREELEPEPLAFEVGHWSCQIVEPSGRVLDVEFEVPAEGREMTGFYTLRKDGIRRPLSGSVNTWWDGEVGGIHIQGFVDGLGAASMTIPVTDFEPWLWKLHRHVAGETTYTRMDAKGFSYMLKLLRKGW